MNDRKFKFLLKLINFLSFVTMEKYWKNGIRIVFKKKKKNNEIRYPSSEVESVSFPVSTEESENVI
ncbi:hypothetical protein DIU31_002900 [Mucilaginibacter rubeus]|uniref:Uncharacterized protein n=1 Tax=Mucilaginibacter rubeus TaxID=2027860 RepID=A0AAE6JBL5_9SPHI|nr:MULTISPECIES: hypothetical protein [Mucilaginibacter]QEM02516.1 hypothetical protein DIU31_002900 [Mucilaginibacter rubeus]QEM15136.1 hypothetical protein DIU38_002925 [Mucilaginibacter gossypii]QTE42141.1 hypothetical protein J3L19_24870 [Mucilaginibacter rubeus]QTE48742.1 hypothetical protein J3L21_24845 [Mucilaginibacter rubeus]QTE53840.1 hypothetical protein J3L23_16475 [Mucilaginibacter rubeus]